MFLCVGTVKDLQFSPYKYTSASIQVYKVSPNGRELEFMHETDVPEPPLALLPFKESFSLVSVQIWLSTTAACVRFFARP